MTDIYVKTSKTDVNLINDFFVIIAKTDRNDVTVTELEKFNLSCDFFIRNNYKTVKDVVEVPLISLIEEEVDPNDYIMFAKENTQSISAKYDPENDVIVFADSSTAVKWNGEKLHGIYDL